MKALWVAHSVHSAHLAVIPPRGSLDDPCHSFHPWVLIISVIVAVGGGGLAENWLAIGYSVNSFAAVGDYSRQDALSAVGDGNRPIYKR